MSGESAHEILGKISGAGADDQGARSHFAEKPDA
jgi:hypothetical protein